MHVPPKRFVRLRHYGLLSSRNKNRKITLCRNLLGCKKYLSRLKDLDAPAIIRLLYNKDVCKCSSCGGRIMPIRVDPSLLQPEPHLLCWHLETEYGSCEAFFKGLFLMQSSQFSRIKQYIYQRIHATLWTEAVWLKTHIYRQSGRALFNQEKSKLMQTKGQLSESTMLLFRLHHLRFFP